MAMKNKVFVKPTKGSLVAGIVVAAAMFIFGLIFMGLLREDNSQIGIIFMIFWLFAMLTIIATFSYNLINYDKSTSSISGEEIELPDSFLSNEKKSDFDARLYKIEKLKNEGLITDNEYADKRKEIMNEKW